MRDVNRLLTSAIAAASFATATAIGGVAVTASPTPDVVEPSTLSVDVNSFGPTPATFTYDLVGSDGSAVSFGVTTAPDDVSPPTTRGVTAGIAATPGISYTLSQRDPGELYRWFDGAGFCFVYGPDGFRDRTVRFAGQSVSFTLGDGERIECFTANQQRGRFDFTTTTTPRSVGKPFTVELAVRDSSGNYQVTQSVRIKNGQTTTTGLLDPRVAYFVRVAETKHWHTDALTCNGRSTSGDAWLRVYLADGLTVNCTIVQHHLVG